MDDQNGWAKAERGACNTLTRLKFLDDEHMVMGGA